MSVWPSPPLLFSPSPYPLALSIRDELGCDLGDFDMHQFPDGESYVKVTTHVRGRDCIVVVDLSHPNEKYLPLLFLLETLRELGAISVGLVAPYLCYMRQDKRFSEGEAVTSRLFANALSQHIDWIVTVDPHLHRFNSLDQIYRVPNRVVQGAPVLADWLKARSQLLLVGPDSESERWVSSIAAHCGHPFVVGQKQRLGDREVKVVLPDLEQYRGREVVIIDDIISSGQTILQCISALHLQNFDNIQCAAVHGIFSGGIDVVLREAGLHSLTTSNTIPHETNKIDMGPLLAPAILICLQQSVRARA